MKSFLLVLCSIVTISLCGFEAGPSGAWEKDGISAKWLITAPGWKSYTLTPQNFKTIDSSSGEMTVDGKSIRFQTSVKTRPDGKIDFQTAISSPSLPAIGHASYQLTLAFDQIRRLILDGKVLSVTPTFVNTRIGGCSGGTHRLILEMADATYQLDGKFWLFIQDDRKWGDTISVRMNPRNDLRTGAPGAIEIAVSVGRKSAGGAPVPGSQKLTIQAGKEWLPVRFSRKIEAGSPLDFSGTLDAPAGKYGRIIVDRNGHFVFEQKPEKRIRFLGVNLCTTANYMTHEESEALAENLAMVGYNTVRFHHFENLLLDKNAKDSVTFDPVMLERFQYLMACLKKRGIYYTLDLYASRTLRPGDGVRNSSEKLGETKLLFDVEPTAMESWKLFARRLLTAKNPYTGLSLAEDPALYVVNLVNEPDISFAASNMAPVLAELFQKRWEEYLAKAGVTGNPPGKPSGMYHHFRAGVELARIQEQTAFLRNELQSKVLVTDLNYYPDYSLLGAAGHFDVVDMHSYWDHMHLLIPNRWSPPLRFTQVSSLGQNAELVRRVMPERVFGLPFISTEINYCFPNRYRTEYGPMAGAYAALQDWDGLYRFQWASGKGVIDPNGLRILTCFDILHDPAAQLADRLIHALFIRGDAAAAPSGVAADFQSRKLQEMDAAQLGKAKNDFETMSLLGLFTRVGALPDGRTFDGVAKLDLTGEWQKALSGRMKTNLGAASNQKRIVSETGEIAITPLRQSIEVVTPRTEAFAGVSGAFGGKVLRVDGVTSPQTVALISLDEKPLAESKKMLLLHLVDMANSNMTFQNSRRLILETPGEAPLLLERRAVQVALRLPEQPTVETLDFEGRRTGEVSASYADGVLRFTADTALREHGVMAYLLSR